MATIKMIDIDITSEKRVTSKNEATVLKRVRRLENNGLAMNWRMSKERDKQITAQLQKNIDNSHLYPIAQVLSATQQSDGQIYIEFKAETFCKAAREISPAIMILNGDGNENAMVIENIHFLSETNKAIINGNISLAKLKNAYLCFGPQHGVNFEMKMDIENNLVKFPKSKQSFQLLPETFMKMCKKM